MRMKKISKATKGLIAASFLIGIIAIITPVMAAGSNHILFMAIGNDLDINASDLIVGNIKSGKHGEPPSVKAVFHQRIYDDSGKKVYTMMGVLKDGYIINTNYYFLCPVLMKWFINVTVVMGSGLFKTTDTPLTLTYRNIFEDVTMPNTGGKFVQATIVMLISFTTEYYYPDPSNPMDPATIPWDEEPLILPEGRWVLAGALWDVGVPVDAGFGYGIIPVGPAAYFTRSWGI
jgi:uncharacterized protein (DUF2237 family)